jgi:hypothetical protein
VDAHGHHGEGLEVRGVRRKGAEMSEILVIIAICVVGLNMYLDMRTIKYQRKTIDLMAERIDLLFECHKVNADILKQFIDAAGKDTNAEK